MSRRRGEGGFSKGTRRDILQECPPQAYGGSQTRWYELWLCSISRTCRKQRTRRKTRHESPDDAANNCFFATLCDGASDSHIMYLTLCKLKQCFDLNATRND